MEDHCRMSEPSVGFDSRPDLFDGTRIETALKLSTNEMCLLWETSMSPTFHNSPWFELCDRPIVEGDLTTLGPWLSIHNIEHDHICYDGETISINRIPSRLRVIHHVLGHFFLYDWSRRIFRGCILLIEFSKCGPTLLKGGDDAFVG